jgi:hypothetical protein
MGGARALGILAVLLSTLSCGGSGSKSPTAAAPVPTPPPPPAGWSAGTVLTVVSGETHWPVAGAKVFVAGAPHVTDADGKVTVGAVAAGVTVDVEAGGHLTRQTLVRAGETFITLWPETEQLSEAYTRALVYTSAATASAEPVSLIRLPDRIRSIALEPSEPLRADWEAMDAHEQAAEAFTRGSQGRLTATLGGAADLRVPTRVDASDKNCTTGWTLMTYLWTSAQEVTKAEIVFCSDQPARLPQPILHEIGHVYGLRHSVSGWDVMYPTYSPSYMSGRWGRWHAFTDPEVLTMALMSQRRAGNAWPDNDRTAKASGRQMIVIVD